MKILGFKEIELNEYVRGMNLQIFNVSMEFVLNSNAQDFGIEKNEHEYVLLEQHLPSYDFDGRIKNKCRLDSLNVRDGNRKKKIYGFLAYSSAMGLVDFIVHKYIPEGESPLDTFLKDFLKNRKKGKATVNKLYNMLFNDAGQPIDKTVYYSIPAISDYVIDNFLNCFECFGRSGRYFLQKLRYIHPRIFYLDDYYMLQGIRIPTRRFFVYLGWENPIFFWDGKKLRQFFASGLNALKQQLGSELWDEFEEKGRCEDCANNEWFLPQQLQAEVVIRIPSRKEAEPFLSENFRKIPVSKECPLPLYLFDTRLTLKMSDNIKLVTNIPEVLAVLSRTIDNIYVPNDEAGDPAVLLKKEKTFMIGVKPNVWSN